MSSIKYQIQQNLLKTPRFILNKGINLKSGEPILIKTSNIEFPDKTSDRRVKEDYSTGKQLNHYSILQYLSLEQSASGLTIIQNNFEGISLTEFLNYGATSLNDFLIIASQMAEVVSFIHHSAFVHKDLNPDIFLINPETLEIRIIDFGQATRIVQEKQQLINLEVLEGSLEFISPEQTGRMNRSIDYRTDLYSLGTIFYRILTGASAYKFQSPLEIIHAHIAQKPVPPHKIHKRIPKFFSKVILKLLSKNAEDRYQSADGLVHDLNLGKNAGSDLENSKIKIAERDFSGTLQIPQKLYGRISQTKNLLDAFERIRKSGLELFLINGYSGVGKTSLVYEIHRPVTLAKGYFTEGKADQLMKSIPYWPWIQALSGLINHLLAEEEIQLLKWSQRIKETVGDVGKVLTEVIPNLELLIGELPQVPELEPTQAQNRFNYVFSQFTQALTADEHPLVLFLDDMQWADSASLNLLKTVLNEEGVENLLIILSYRSNEVSPTHPLMLTMEEVFQSSVSNQTIKVENLKKKDVEELISDSLKIKKKDISELTNLIFEKTNGNPFFVKEFLKSLFENGHLNFDFHKKQWQWDVDSIRNLNITSNVVELLEADVLKLPPDIISVLKMAACIGHRFDEKTLMLISEQSPFEILEVLEIARIEGYIEKIDTENYKFSHDRIHEIFYEQIPENQKQNTHVSIGQLLFQNAPEDKLEQQIFTIANHWNTGLDLVKDIQEHETLFNLNLQAAQKAKLSNAYHAANGYLEVASQIVGNLTLNPKDPDWFILHRESAEIAYLLTDYERSEKIIEMTLENTDELKQQMDLYCMLILQYTMTSQFGEAIKVGKTSLKKLGIDIPNEGIGDLIGQEIGVAFGRLGSNPPSSLLEISEMSDEKQIMATKIYASMLAPSFFTNQELFALIVTKIVNLSMEHGNVPASCFGYGCFGLILATVSNYEKGFEFGKLAYDLAKNFNDPTEQGRACFHLAEFTSVWTKPFQYARQRNREGFLHALDAGDLQYAGYLSIYDAFYSFYQEKSVPEVLKSVRESLSFSKKTKNYISEDTVQGLEIVLSCLCGLTNGKDNFDIEKLKESKYLSTCLENKNVLAICIYQIIKGQVLYIHNESHKAMEALDEAQKFLPYISGMFFTAEYNFYSSMTMMVLLDSLTEEKKKIYLNKIKTNQEALKLLSESCPENWHHKYLLVEAELSLDRNEYFKAIEQYRRSIDAAMSNNFSPLQALGNERIAQLWIDKREITYAGLHLREALYIYEKIGAVHKSVQISDLLTKLGVTHTHSGSITNSLLSTHKGAFDIESVLKASQTLSSEIVLEKLLEKLMHIVIENAGAEKGILLIERKDNWYVKAIGELGGKIVVLENVLLEGSKKVPESIIKYVARTKENLVIQSAIDDKRFFFDGYIIKNKSKSILCTTVSISGNQNVILYLENNLLEGAFTDDRVQLLKVLSSQIAISLENALLYQTLEEKVKERTVELEFQKDQSEKLLLNILPEETAKELKLNGKVKPRLHENVTILFIDVVNFTSIAKRMSPENLIQDLDYYYKAFDQIMSKYGIEKIKTIGDAFFAASGLPTELPDHAQLAVLAGKDVLEFVAKEKKKNKSLKKNYFEVRVGIHSGDVIAGVVGTSKYSFDIWGSDVNIAARMESNGQTGKINISESTFHLIKNDFNCEHRGQINAKGLGGIDMYFVK